MLQDIEMGISILKETPKLQEAEEKKDDYKK